MAKKNHSHTNATEPDQEEQHLHALADSIELLLSVAPDNNFAGTKSNLQD